MRYERGNVIIEVSRVDGFGKYPGLWIGTKNPNTLTKVASFRNDICAETCIKWLDYIMEFSANEPTMREENVKEMGV